MRIVNCAAGALLALNLALSALPARADDAACEAKTGQWLDPASGRALPFAAVLEELDKSRVVLLGETHTRMDHHRWQLQMLAALKARRGDLAVGFEMFPRAAQPVLDLWAADELSGPEFLERTDWRRVWTFDHELYLPLFEFARMNRQAMVALNVDRGLVRRVGREGWAAIPEDEREGLSEPAPALQAYEDFLWTIFQSHPTRGGNEDDTPKTRSDPGFQGFVRGQQTWDRAMAEAIANALKREPDRLVVGILGMAHAQEGWGVPHQLAALGVEDVAVLLPWTRGEECEALTAGVADAVFMLKRPPEKAAPPKPRLGVLIGNSTDPVGVKVQGVSPNSVAEAADLKKDDVIVEAAGIVTAKTPLLIAIVQRQAPGTWLPLVVQRDGERMELIAKFPSQP